MISTIPSKEDFRKFTKSRGIDIRSYSPQVMNDDGNIVDIHSKMLEDRIIFLTSEVDSHSANLIKSQLLYLNTISDDDISIYIDSPGGEVYTGLGILDVMDFVKSDVCTLNMGLAASMGALILTYGKKGKRKALKRSRTMIHQPLGGHYGQASDIEINTKEIISLKNELNLIIADATSQDLSVIETDTDRDYWMGSKDAKDYGLIDIIL
jgi:ATP-dependent Clp protease protease subunit